MGYEQIPTELQALNQWCCWRKVDRGPDQKPDKPPICPHTLEIADVVNDPSKRSSFEHAVSVVNHNPDKVAGIGFVFTNNDPYTFIDLDYTDDPQTHALQSRIYEVMNSYSEKSPSKAGLHIIVKAEIVASRKRNGIELYNRSRYATFTGDVWNNQPIMERQQEINELFKVMSQYKKDNVIHVIDAPEREDDSIIINRAAMAHNGELFRTLWEGNWQTLYPSQSEADYALIDIIAFYTDNMEQVGRIFHKSALGRRKKAFRQDYLERMILNSFDRKLQTVPIEIIKRETAPAPVGTDAAGVSGYEQFEDIDYGSIVKPPGLVGEIADFVYWNSPYPTPEAAITAALGLMAGLCGRCYHVSNTGLNLYLCLIALTGTGKDTMRKSLSNIRKALKPAVNAIDVFFGADEPRSDAGLLKMLERQPSCVSMMSEFGRKLDQMCGVKASSHNKSIADILLRIYGDSGPKGSDVGAMVYSDKTKNTPIIEAPAYSLIADSTPSTFYGVMTNDLIEQGLLQRFIIIEYDGDRPIYNTYHEHAFPSEMLLGKLFHIATNAITWQHNKYSQPVWLDSKADTMSTTFRNYCDDTIRQTKEDSLRNMWSRAWLNTLKIAALVAVGINPSNPCITSVEFGWAQQLVTRSVRMVIAQLEGKAKIQFFKAEETQAQEIITKEIKRYLEQPYPALERRMNKVFGKRASILGPKIHADRVIPESFLMSIVYNISVYKNSRNRKQLFKDSIEALKRAGMLTEVSHSEAFQRYGSTVVLYGWLG